MVNDYCQSSNFVDIPEDQLDAARQIVDRVIDELRNSEEAYVGFVAEICVDGVWIYEDEIKTIDPENVEKLVRALVEELDLPGIYACSWAFICSKPRVDEFGGGAFAVSKGHETVWVDATETLHFHSQSPSRWLQSCNGLYLVALDRMNCLMAGNSDS